MMTLSTHFNWDTPQFPNSETNTFHEEVAAPNLQNLFPYSDESFYLSNPIFENYTDPNCDFLYPNGDFLHPSEVYPPYDPFLPFTYHDIFPTPEDHNLLRCPKRQKCCYDEQLLQYLPQQELTIPSVPSNFLEGFVVLNDNTCSLQGEEVQQELTIPTVPSNFLEGFVVLNDNTCSLQGEEVQPEVFYEIPQLGTSVDLGCQKKCENKVNERIISSQSIAARERRKKISEKTQELGKLVPGGPKMNTAEMLHAAAKYVKYLQAQVGMLELMISFEEDKAAPPSEILHNLIVSPLVQEKLYTEEMCFAPKEIVTTLTNHEDVQSKPTIVEDLKQLIGTDIE